MSPVCIYAKEVIMEEKVKKWEEEIEKITEQQKEMNEKYNDRIRSLRKKIQEANAVIRQENNLMIADAVREIYGEVNRETLETFKQKMKSLREENSREPLGNKL